MAFFGAAAAPGAVPTRPEPSLLQRILRGNVLPLATVLGSISVALTVVLVVTRRTLTAQEVDRSRKMLAAVFSKYGGETRVAAVPRPRVARGDDVLIEIRASSVNPVDWKIRQGNLWPLSLLWVVLPNYVSGRDLSGVVVEVGPQVKNFRVGDEVMALTKFWQQGSYAQYIVCAESIVAPKPANATHEEAAGLPLVALTAWQALVETAQVQPGERVLVLGGSGGVGTVAIPMLRHHLGAHVVATCSSRNAALVRELGAHQVVDYTRETVAEATDGEFDVVFDIVGGPQMVNALDLVRPGGRFVTISGPLPDSVPDLRVIATLIRTILRVLWYRFVRKIRSSMVFVRHDGPQLLQVGRLVEEHIIRPRIFKALPLAQIAEAHHISKEGRATGKIVLVHKKTDASLSP